ncbi:MAG: NAD-dependent epimerase/dehydratase family protein, partial [Burkholderia gladioli]
MKVFITGAGGFIGGSIAAGLAADGHQVVGLVRREAQAEELRAIGVEPRIGSLDDRDLLIREAQAADAVINAADSDHRGAVEALIEGLRDSGKVLLHTSGSSIVGDASGGEGSDRIYEEDALPEPTADKAARVAIDTLVLSAAQRGMRAAVLCNTLIYGHGLGLPRESVQLPRLIRQAQKSGVVRHVGPGRNIWSNV